MTAEEFFATEWPAMVPRLTVMLARTGVPAADREDVIQETALRLFRIWDTVDPTRSPEPLAMRIATNNWRDIWRHRDRREVVGSVPDQVAAHDTERTALAKIEISEVSRALSTLTPSAARLLRTAASEAEGEKAGGRTEPAVRMARSRARRALAACLQVASGMAAAALVSLRAAGRSVRPVTAAGALVGLAVIITASAPPPTAASRPNLRWDDARPSAGHPAGTHLAAAHVHSHDAGSRATRVAAVAHAVPVPPTRDRQRPYRVAVGPTEVDVFVDLDVMGYGVRVSKPQPGGIPVGSPACVHGSTPSTLVVPTCS